MSPQAQIATIDARVAKIAARLNLLDFHGSLFQRGSQASQAQAAALRQRLIPLLTRRYQLECLIPTPEVLADRAYHRALRLGSELEEAESRRLSALRAARFTDDRRRAA